MEWNHGQKNRLSECRQVCSVDSSPEAANPAKAGSVRVLRLWLRLLASTESESSQAESEKGDIRLRDLSGRAREGVCQTLMSILSCSIARRAANVALVRQGSGGAAEQTDVAAHR